MLEMCRIELGNDGDRPLDARLLAAAHRGDGRARATRVLALALKTTVAGHRDI